MGHNRTWDLLHRKQASYHCATKSKYHAKKHCMNVYSMLHPAYGYSTGIKTNILAALIYI